MSPSTVPTRTPRSGNATVLADGWALAVAVAAGVALAFRAALAAAGASPAREHEGRRELVHVRGDPEPELVAVPVVDHVEGRPHDVCAEQLEGGDPVRVRGVDALARAGR